ncbi:dephospho-CoA kinase [Actinophytocola xinjiangensis]|uniref:Dephospho-CoA kinase n=1 Tax=Actinophytocola xinjiangensis TaxID=485602 RepID=A0A7Z0WLC1_9PSEU|nr:dephospho-CoA kinase [Actinophytocola xinjiangensis]OLF10110.1 dephospho-CoA kinase [Actinophytocola xinjiangensis]
MLRVGLTGGIGSGKSTVAGRLAEHGAVVIDADRLAREVVEPGTPGLAAVAGAFGDDILDAAGALDRARLAARVFNDDAARTTLTSIVHPLIAERTGQLMAAAPADAIVVHDVPLLVENAIGPAYHLVIVVDAPVETRVARVVRDRGMPEADARARIAAQASEEARRAVADVWLDNGGWVDEILAEVDALWADRLVRYESNIRLGHANQYGGPRLRSYDPAWSAQAERLIARIRAGIGDPSARVDHIGSTSVPGLPARDIIDLQLTVESLDQADAFAEPLAAAGFPLAPHVSQDEPQDPDDRGKRLHESADPGRLAQVHLRVKGSPGWRLALLFPAWIRGEEGVLEEYRGVKERLSALYEGDTERYEEAKEAWFAEGASRAQEWAERVGWRA